MTVKQPRRPFNKFHAALAFGLPVAAVFGAGLGTKIYDLLGKKNKAEEELNQLKTQTIPLILATTIGSGAIAHNITKDKSSRKYGKLGTIANEYLIKQATTREIYNLIKKRLPGAIKKYYPYMLGGVMLSPVAYFSGRGLLGLMFRDKEKKANKYIPTLHAVNTLGPLAGVAAGGLIGYGSGLTQNLNKNRQYYGYE